MKTSIITVLLFCIALPGITQPRIPGPMPKDYSKTLQAGMLRISADKYIAETNEQVTLTVVADLADAEGNPGTYDYRPEDPATGPWFAKDWKIADGGGQIHSSLQNGNAYFAVLTTPGSIPPSKSVTVEVTLEPIDKRYAKVILRQTIFVEDNKNVFYFDCPVLGIQQEKYIVKNNGGAFAVPDATVAKAINMKNAQVQQRRGEYALKAAAADISATQSGFDLAALSSNAKAIYVPDQDITSILINGDSVSMAAGIPVKQKRSYMIALSVPGRSTGSFAIKSRKEIAVAITLPFQRSACSCLDDPPQREADHTPPPACNGGFVTITRYDKQKKIVEGTLSANLETQVGEHTYFGNLSGKFSVVLAMQ